MNNVETQEEEVQFETSCSDEEPGAVVAMWRRDGTAVFVNCGSYSSGEKMLCADHQAKYEAMYPQGWRGYPGDICRHGMYTGGSGADLMCGYCESGYGGEEDEE